MGEGVAGIMEGDRLVGDLGGLLADAGEVRRSMGSSSACNGF